MKKIVKAIYSIFPMKLPLFNLLKKIWQPPQSIYRHLHFKGIYQVHLGKSETFKIKHYGYEIENELFWRGIADGWEKVSINLWIQLCRKAKIIIDVGANTGVYSLVAKAVNSNAKVYAFEPVNRVYYKLVVNNDINNYDIVCLKKAVSNYTGKAVIYDTNEEHVYSVTVNKNIHNASLKVVQSEIETITFSDFITASNISNIDLIKIDVETHEPEVLEGFGNYLKKYQPTMLIEVLNDEVGHKINELVKDIGYCYFNIDENKGIRQVNKIERSDYFNYLLCKEEIAKELKLI